MGAIASEPVYVDANVSGLAWVVEDVEALSRRIAIVLLGQAVVAYLISFIDPCNWTVGEILRRMVLPKKVPAKFDRKYPILCDCAASPSN
ncbi:MULTISPECIES: hypothetical protein [unclassified Sphingomonas]|uniref:hypothetical protein n=1 Tax=unclassified Sphingomonas TaxID=196159 RepID=UPI00226AFAFF|nr:MULTISPECIES: hypothetical protein [unclassified Sphingomonas]